ncbi:MAG: hypothetical protein J1F64_06100 [Oscillospiraceae bacterium]|nr:hypothetical protein [Oscillospiraceae bacterium]
MKTRNISYITNTVIFFLLISIGFVTVVICPADKKSSENENRTLAEMPVFNCKNLLSGSFASDFETYLTDNVGFRSSFTDMNMYYEDMKGISYFGDIVKVKKDMGMESDDDGEHEMKSLLVLNDRILEIFEENEDARKSYIDVLNFYADKIPENIRLYNLIIPTQIEFTNAWYSSASDSQKETIDYIYSDIDERIQTIDVYDALKEHRNEYIYFRTDHHWTALGAYYAVNEFLARTGKRRIDINNYTRNDLPGFFGFLYGQAGTKKLEKNPDTISYYIKYEGENILINAKGYDAGEPVDYQCNMFDLPDNEPPKYKVFLTGDHTFLHIETGSETGRSILIIKDSYANAFIPWLRERYDHIYVIDPRTYKESLSDLFEEYDIDEVLIFNYSFTTTFEDYSEMLRDIYN